MLALQTFTYVVDHLLSLSAFLTLFHCFTKSWLGLSLYESSFFKTPDGERDIEQHALNWVDQWAD